MRFPKGKSVIWGPISQNFLGFPPHMARIFTSPTNLTRLGTCSNLTDFGSETPKITVFSFLNITTTVQKHQNERKKTFFFKILYFLGFSTTFEASGSPI